MLIITEITSRDNRISEFLFFATALIKFQYDIPNSNLITSWSRFDLFDMLVQTTCHHQFDEDPSFDHDQQARPSFHLDAGDNPWIYFYPEYQPRIFKRTSRNEKKNRKKVSCVLAFKRRLEQEERGRKKGLYDACWGLLRNKEFLFPNQNIVIGCIHSSQVVVGGNHKWLNNTQLSTPAYRLNNRFLGALCRIFSSFQRVVVASIFRVLGRVGACVRA